MLLTVLVPMGVAAREDSTSYAAFIHLLVYMTLFLETFSVDITSNETFSVRFKAMFSLAGDQRVIVHLLAKIS